MFLVMLIIGIVTALVGSIAGLGGGVILVPVLLFLGDHFVSFDWVNPQSIVGISLVVMIFTGMSSVISYMKHQRVDEKIGLVFLFGSIPGGILGAWLNQFFETDGFSLFFGIVMIAVSLLFFIPRRTAGNSLFKTGIEREKVIDGTVYKYRMPFVVGLILSFAVGMLSGLLGIGGGSLMVPAMILLLNIPPHIATATSMFMIFFASITSSSAHIILGHVDWSHTLWFIPGAYLGGMLGAWINRLLDGQAVEKFLRVLLVLIGIRLIWQGLG
ncbi:sulfite exporter TauE/SafE family protein [Halobacillus karajensis]|uniref:Probable membrane transporter protein n=1 Tax=Halobacillus karajensis TaxID=195088 RepID=A0A024P9N7_9BACI|nr:sulfite exporter TauE/SafE family protein [Halobacillus karajensis]CDQ21280.1 Sulfite exporter TauE/SafE [Halobacillus karajensis]CDQ25650.1 Sulfite exporter TauE/SafE [Halobacillus karajensis]CDQ25921.1 Sulfite exporter TauE/SafE [Halobacillus karajensis]